MNEKNLKKLITDSKENEHIEYKAASNDYSILGGPKKDKGSLYGYCVGIGNAGGGKIIFGVANDKKITGTNAFPDIEKTKSTLYRYLGVKVGIEVINTSEGRVVLVDIPKRETGKLFNFYGIYLTRVGEELIEMNQREIKETLHESIEDFSAKYIDANITALDKTAVDRMRFLYEEKYFHNESLKSLSDEQFLSDIGLMKKRKLNNTALILLGTEISLRDLIPNAEIVFEYRTDPSNVRYSDRANLRKPLIFSLDTLWEKINSRNFITPYTDGLFRKEIAAFNEDVIREAVLNAVVHRNYEASTSIFIKQDNLSISIVSPGGFILDVTPENIYKKSAWRNRRLAETLEKLGLVERSGQGADLIFEQTIKEGKGLPNYLGSTLDEVSLVVSAVVKDQEFIAYLEAITREAHISLSTDDLVCLERIKDRNVKGLKIKDLQKFLDAGLVVKSGSGRGINYLLAKKYYKDHGRLGEYTKLTGLGRTKTKELILKHIKENGQGTAKEFKQAFNELTPKDVDNLLQEMRRDGSIKFVRKLKNNHWALGDV